MGSLTSKNLDESATKSGSETPKRPKVLPFDPRSPSESISRTPITVTNNGDDPLSNTPATGKVKVLKFDPRSPSCEISRTPIEVEGKFRSRHQPFIPSKLASISTNMIDDLQECDPRSPTEKVPRTPFEDSNYEPSIDTKFDEIKNSEENEEKTIKLIEQKENYSVSISTKLQESKVTQMRPPLASIQNNVSNELIIKTDTNKNQTVENEYCSTQKSLLTQLCTIEDDKKISTTTEFIEDI